MLNIQMHLAFYIGPIPVPWYGIFLTLGLLAAAIATFIEWRKKGYSMTLYGWLFIVVIISGFYSARWFYLILNPTDIHSFWDFLRLSGGRTITGGIIGATLITWGFIKVAKLPIDPRQVFSVVLPNLLLAQAIGRWGNFANHEVYGQSVESLSHLPDFISNQMYIYPVDPITGLATGDPSYRVPLFLYESFFCFLGWLIITFLMKPNNYFKPGTHGAAYFIWYGTLRASMELLRDPTYIMKIGDVPTSFILAIIMAISGIIAFIVLQYKFWDYMFWVEKSRGLRTRLNYDIAIVKIKLLFNKIDKSEAENKLNDSRKRFEEKYIEVSFCRSKYKHKKILDIYN